LADPASLRPRRRVRAGLDIVARPEFIDDPPDLLSRMDV
jgi:hypothetical protein